MRIEEIKKIRRCVGLTQTEFAEKIGVTKTCVSNWELGLKEPYPSNIKKIIEFCEERDIKITRE